jgi:hypothetical protein
VLGASARARFLLLVPISVSQCKYILVHGLGCAHSAPRGTTLPEDIARWVESGVELTYS